MSEPSLQLPSSYVLSALGAIVTGAFGWMLRLERRSSKTDLRLDNHEIQCAKRQADLKEDLQEIKDHLQRQDEKSEEHRERMNKQLVTIGVKVAVIQTKMKTPPTGDTGTYEQVSGS